MWAAEKARNKKKQKLEYIDPATSLADHKILLMTLLRIQSILFFLLLLLRLGFSAVLSRTVRNGEYSLIDSQP